ncbi:MAG: hypothetical protein ACP6IP_03125 [Candidatus Njordarchaeia archaeon]
MTKTKKNANFSQYSPMALSTSKSGNQICYLILAHDQIVYADSQRSDTLSVKKEKLSRSEIEKILKRINTCLNKCIEAGVPHVLPESYGKIEPKDLVGIINQAVKVINREDPKSPENKTSYLREKWFKFLIIAPQQNSYNKFLEEIQGSKTIMKYIIIIEHDCLNEDFYSILNKIQKNANENSKWKEKAVFIILKNIEKIFPYTQYKYNDLQRKLNAEEQPKGGITIFWINDIKQIPILPKNEEILKYILI